MHRLALEVFELGHPVSDIVAVGVTLFRLGEGVEYPKVRLGVCASLFLSAERCKTNHTRARRKTYTGCPLPSAIVGCQIAINEVLHKVFLT